MHVYKNFISFEVSDGGILFLGHFYVNIRYGQYFVSGIYLYSNFTELKQFVGYSLCCMFKLFCCFDYLQMLQDKDRC
jgi:hypothetical protein